MNVAIIGGGAAGFFSAIAVMENHPHARVIIYEKSQKILSKLKISGGGRCNVTNACSSIPELIKAYPRGGKKLKKAFHIFNNKHTMEWFEKRGVPLMVQEDNCVFPVSQQSQSIIDCFMSEVERLQISVELGIKIQGLKPMDEHIQLEFADPDLPPRLFDKVIVTSGGAPQRKNLEWLEQLGHKIEDPVPSLFTFNMPDEAITALMGIVVENTLVSIQGSKFKSGGPLLITHWGMSGPAILKLSSLGARYLSERNYEFNVQVNWVNETNNTLILEVLEEIIREHPKKLITNIRPFLLPERLWLYLIEKCDLNKQKIWGEIGKKSLNKLVNTLSNDVYAVKGKSTFKQEFVTCGGVSLDSIDMKNMQSKACRNLYFSGEVTDIDAITGGYNFQGAWTTAHIAGMLME
jgi:predicted Rossmann fold flavoprotein